MDTTDGESDVYGKRLFCICVDADLQRVEVLPIHNPPPTQRTVPIFGQCGLGEFENERKSIRKPAAAKRIRREFSRKAFIRAFRKSVARRLEVFTGRVNVAKARDALRDLLSDGRLVMRADLENQRFE